MEQRIQIDAVEPNAFKAMFNLENYMQQGQLTKQHYELIKLRASQINSCAFCINMHTEESLKLGEDPKRLLLLDAWRDTDYFSEEEKMILQLTEEVTMIHKNGVTDHTYTKALSIFDENYFAQIIMGIVTINAWNRIAISTLKPF